MILKTEKIGLKQLASKTVNNIDIKLDNLTNQQKKEMNSKKHQNFFRIQTKN